MPKRINIGPWISTYILHKKVLSPSNKAIGPGNPKFIRIGPMSIPESRVNKNPKSNKKVLHKINTMWNNSGTTVVPD